MKKILDEKAAHQPNEGHNVVGEDDFAHAGERLYLIAHYKEGEEKQAQDHAAQHMKDNPGSKVHVYSAKKKAKAKK